MAGIRERGLREVRGERPERVQGLGVHRPSRLLRRAPRVAAARGIAAPAGRRRRPWRWRSGRPAAAFPSTSSPSTSRPRPVSVRIQSTWSPKPRATRSGRGSTAISNSSSVVVREGDRALRLPVAGDAGRVAAHERLARPHDLLRVVRLRSAAFSRYVSISSTISSRSGCSSRRARKRATASARASFGEEALRARVELVGRRAVLGVGLPDGLLGDRECVARRPPVHLGEVHRIGRGSERSEPTPVGGLQDVGENDVALRAACEQKKTCRSSRRSCQSKGPVRGAVEDLEAGGQRVLDQHVLEIAAAPSPSARTSTRSPVFTDARAAAPRSVGARPRAGSRSRASRGAGCPSIGASSGFR